MKNGNTGENNQNVTELEMAKVTEITPIPKNIAQVINVEPNKLDENNPPPVNLATLPPRSSLHETPIPVPLELLAPISKRPASTEISSSKPTDPIFINVPNESPISLVGNMIDKDQKPSDDPILVSTAYTNLPSPLSVPAPSEIPNAPLVINNPNMHSYRPMMGQEAQFIAQRTVPGHMYMQPVLMPNSVMTSRVSYVQQQPVYMDAYVQQHFDVLNYTYYPIHHNLTGTMNNNPSIHMANQVQNMPMSNVSLNKISPGGQFDPNMGSQIPVNYVVPNETSRNQYSDASIMNIHNSPNIPLNNYTDSSTLSNTTNDITQQNLNVEVNETPSGKPCIPEHPLTAKLSSDISSPSCSNMSHYFPSSESETILLSEVTQVKKRPRPPVPIKPNRLSLQFSESNRLSGMSYDENRLSGYYPETSRFSVLDPDIQNDPEKVHNTVKTNMHASISSESIGKKESFAPILDKVTRIEVGLHCIIISSGRLFLD